MPRAIILAAVLLLAMTVIPSAIEAGLPDAAERHAGGRFGTSTNWAGYAVETNLASPASGVVTDVRGSWIVPAVACSADGTDKYSASWIGIDGYSSRSVEQTGTESDCLGGGATPSYAAWYEMYPKGSHRLSQTVHAGDSMTSEVRYTNGAFTLTLTDATAGWSFVTSQHAKAVRSSAEWIIEAPWSGGVLPLANFGTTTFTGASATISSHTGPIGDAAWQRDAIDMANGAGQTKAATSALDASGAFFSVAWQRAT